MSMKQYVDFLKDVRAIFFLESLTCVALLLTSFYTDVFKNWFLIPISVTSLFCFYVLFLTTLKNRQKNQKKILNLITLIPIFYILPIALYLNIDIFIEYFTADSNVWLTLILAIFMNSIIFLIHLLNKKHICKDAKQFLAEIQ